MQLLYVAMAADMKRELKAKKAELMAKLADMPDSQLKAKLLLLSIISLSYARMIMDTLLHRWMSTASIVPADCNATGHAPSLTERSRSLSGRQLVCSPCADPVGAGQPPDWVHPAEVRAQ